MEGKLGKISRRRALATIVGAGAAAGIGLAVNSGLAAGAPSTPDTASVRKPLLENRIKPSGEPVHAAEVIPTIAPGLKTSFESVQKRQQASRAVQARNVRQSETRSASENLYPTHTLSIHKLISTPDALMGVDDFLGQVIAMGPNNAGKLGFEHIYTPAGYLFDALSKDTFATVNYNQLLFKTGAKTSWVPELPEAVTDVVVGEGVVYVSGENQVMYRADTSAGKPVELPIVGLTEGDVPRSFTRLKTNQDGNLTNYAVTDSGAYQLEYQKDQVVATPLSYSLPYNDRLIQPDIDEDFMLAVNEYVTTQFLPNTNNPDVYTVGTAITYENGVAKYVLQPDLNLYKDQFSEKGYEGVSEVSIGGIVRHKKTNNFFVATNVLRGWWADDFDSPKSFVPNIEVMPDYYLYPRYLLPKNGLFPKLGAIMDMNTLELNGRTYIAASIDVRPIYGGNTPQESDMGSGLYVFDITDGYTPDSKSTWGKLSRDEIIFQHTIIQLAPKKGEPPFSTASH